MRNNKNNKLRTVFIFISLLGRGFSGLFNLSVFKSKISFITFENIVNNPTIIQGKKVFFEIYCWSKINTVIKTEITEIKTFKGRDIFINDDIIVNVILKTDFHHFGLYGF